MTYTREQILNTPVGRELDQLVANAIGYVSLTTHLNTDGSFGHLPAYSTNISAAWEVVEKLSRGRTNNSFFLELHYERCFASFGNADPLMFNSAPEAICKAALLASLGESGGTGE